MGKSRDLNKGRTCEDNPADTAHHHNPVPGLLELRLSSDLLLRYPGAKAELLTRDLGENAQIQSTFCHTAAVRLCLALCTEQDQVPSSQMLPLCQLIFSVKQ